MTIRNLDEANQALQAYVPLVAQLEGKDVTLQRIVPLMKLLDDPQDKLRVVHIAGTSGKTSTAYYMAALLTAAGKKTGLTVSPHIDSVTERIQVNGRPLSEAEFCELLAEFLDIIRQVKQPPSYFELLYAFALWVFGQQDIDYAVVETGMGGLHDATNVTTRVDKVCVITDIGFDHTHILGKTLAEISFQKAGIIQPGNHIFMYEQAEEIMQIVRDAAADRGAVLHLVKESNISPYENMPGFQRRNWQLAHHAYQYLKQRDEIQNLTSQALRETQSLQVPARMDIRKFRGKTLVMDGAHNAQKLASFLASFLRLYPDAKPAILIGLKHGKEYEELAPLLAPLTKRIIATAFYATQDLPVRSMDPDKLAEVFKAQSIQAESIPDLHQAFETLLNGPEKVCIITGSFYLLSQIRNNEDLI